MMKRHEILKKALSGDIRCLARAITLIELRDRKMGEQLGATQQRRSKGPKGPHVIGITGAPGAGKSTWVDWMIKAARKRNERVAVIAVDPSSPFSGGAILGDRIRMESHTLDEGVYTRSLSSRGHLGGLSSATSEVVSLLDATGYDLILVETVGVGQSELGVMEVADTVVVIVTPESGDAVQAMKAGLFEVADVFLINKCDRPGGDSIARDLTESLSLASNIAWSVPVVKGAAIRGEGLEELLCAVEAHLAWCRGPGVTQWAERRGNARLRFFLDLVAEQRRHDVIAAMDAHLEERIREGLIGAYAALDLLK